MSIRIFGIEIERRTDVLAFAAFVISVGSMVAQMANLIKGPQVELQAPRQVLFNLHQYPDGRHYLQLSAKMIYLNTGSPGYDDIIKLESARLKIGEQNIELIGQDYVSIESLKGGLNINIISDADPVQVKSGAVISHETYFAPWPSGEKDPATNFVTKDKLLAGLKDVAKVRVTFKAETYSGAKMIQECVLKTKEFLPYIEQKMWSAPVCHTET